MENNQNFPPSKIKEVYIELPDYTFRHNDDSDDFLYVGRDNIKNRLTMLLSNSGNCPSGAYLITGYRGMGKTSLVDSVINELNKNENTHTFEESEIKINEKNYPKFIKLDISLSQENVKEMDVIRLMVRQLQKELEKIDIELVNFPSHNRVQFSNIKFKLDELWNGINFNESELKIPIQSNNPSIKKYERQTGKKLTKSKLTPNESEKELIDILNKLENIRDRKNINNNNIPDFIFVVDELDKIEHGIGFKNDSENVSKSRTEIINGILANLKHFLNTAKAKFIFIGGRDMYDAALADIADRDSFYSSIFHDILYVKSFLKENVTIRSGITQVTENYLSKVILQNQPISNSQKQNYNLKAVFNHFKSLPNATEITKFTNEEQYFKEQQRNEEIYKTIILLQNLVLFLTFRSNGTPKKLVSIIESYMIWKKDDEILKNSSNFILFNKTPLNENSNRKRIYLRFGFNKQYEIGLSSNLYRPYAINNSRYLKNLGDKLLFSTTFMVDYILKFHQHPFSWRNLEMIPEIILVNKDPNLRQYLEDLLKSFSNMYLRETVNSIFQYKFFIKAAQEIKLLTKISETASAAYNFTLDESELIKNYYRNQLSELQKIHTNYQEEFIHSIAFIQSILADLHYFDGEYDKAIVYHTNSLQVLRHRAQYSKEGLTKHQVVLFVKHKLLLGLCLEKIKAYDSAYSIYRGLILNVPSLIDRALVNKSEKQEFGSLSEWDSPIRRMQLFIRPHIALLDLIEKQRMDGVTYSNLLRNFREVHDFLIEKDKIEFNLEIGAKINKRDKQQDKVRIHTLLSDYYGNVGSLLFFKNKNFHELLKALSKEEIGKIQYVKDSQPENSDKSDKYSSYSPSISALIYYKLAFRDIILKYQEELFKLKDDFEFEDREFKTFSKKESYYAQSVFLLLTQAEGTSSALSLFNIGNLLSKISDTILSSINFKNASNGISDTTLILYGADNYNEIKHSEKQNVTTNQILLKILSEFRKKENESELTFDNVLLINRLAGFFYRKAGKNYSYAFTYKKFLFILKDYICFFRNMQATKDFSIIEKSDLSYRERNQNSNIEDKMPIDFTDNIIKCSKNVAERVFTIHTWIQDVANRPQILKYREMLDIKNRNETEKSKTSIIYLNISTSPEIRETIAIVEEIRLKILFEDTKLKKIFDRSFKNIVSPNDVITSRFTRIIELRLQAEINSFRLQELGIYDLLGEAKIAESKIQEVRRKTNKEIENQLKLFICDSIYALMEVIRTLKLYGVNYVSSYSYLASNHRNLGRWCQIFENYKIIFDSQIEKDLENIIGKEDMFSIEANYHYELALQNYYNAIQVHTEGNAYKLLNKSMSFSEDDFNDNLTHFCAASERFRYNTGLIQKQIKRMKMKIEDSRLYDYDNYRYTE